MNAITPTPFKAEGPQPLVRTTPTGAAYPVHALGPLRDVVEAVHGQMQAPIAIPAQSALAVASLAVQGIADVDTLAGSRPTSLYLLTVAQSGERKTTCDGMLLKGLRAFERTQANAQRDDMEAWRVANAIWAETNKKLLQQVTNKDQIKRTEAQADLEAQGPAPEQPRSTDRTVKEPTYEGLIRKFVEGQPSLALFSDEGGQFFGGNAMGKENRQKTLSAFNDLWQGSDIQRTRSGDGSFTLSGRRFGTHLMAQPSIVRGFMADPLAVDTGFLPRFLMTEPVSTIGTRLQANTKTNPEALGAFEKRLTTILETPMTVEEKSGALELRVLPLSADARAILVVFSDETEVGMLSGGIYADVKGYASKAAEQAARIAGVLTLWADLNAQEVSGKTMSDAVDLATFYQDEALRLSNAAIVSLDIDRAERLRVWLLEKWPDPIVLPSDVLQFAPITALRERPTANKAIGTLVEAGWLAPLEADTMVRGKARKKAYQIVRPAL